MNIYKKFYFYMTICISIYSSFGHTITLDNSFTKGSLYSDLLILEDKNYKAADVNKIEEAKWKRVKSKKDLIYKFSKKTYWLKINITNKNQKHSNWVIYPTGYPSKLTLFSFNEKAEQNFYSETGVDSHFSSHAMRFGKYGTKVNIAYNKSKAFYIKYRPYYTAQLEMNLATPYKYQLLNSYSLFFWGLYLGCVLVLVVYNLSSYISSRDTAYLTYSFFSMSICVYIFSKYNPLKTLDSSISGDMRLQWLAISSSMIMVFTLDFQRRFFTIKKYKKLFNQLTNLSICIFVGSSVYGLFQGISITMTIVVKNLILVYTLLMTVFAIYKTKTGNHSALFYTLGLTCLTAGSIIININNSSNYISGDLEEFVIPIASLLELLFMSIALTSRFSILRKKLVNDLKSHEIKLEAEVSLRTKQLVSGEKFSALGRMAKGIAHEINNPLMIIGGNVGRLKKGIDRNDNPENLYSRIDKIKEANKRISVIVSGFLCMAEDSKDGVKSVIHLRDIVDDATSFLAHKLKMEDIKLIVDFDVPHDLILGDPKKLFSVFITLISNAIEAISEEEISNKWIKIFAYEKIDENSTRIYVDLIDSGKTPKVAIRTRMFEPFFNTKKLGDTLGLSLPIARSIIKAHEGDLVCLEEEEHTTFEIRLPKAS